jgi:hypothetical protein
MDEARRLLFDLGTDRFGAPDPVIRDEIEREPSVERLERLARAVLHAVSWAELMRL